MNMIQISADRRLDDCVSTEFQENLAITYTNGVSQCCMTYSQLLQNAQSIKDALCLEIRDHEMVAFIVSDAGPVAVSLILGVLKLPAAFIFLDKNNSSDYQLNLIKRLQIRFLVVDIECIELSWIQNSNTTAIEVDYLKHLGVVLLKFGTSGVSSITKNRNQNIAYAITTSGTTGEPKIVRVPHSCIVPNILDFRRIFKVKNDCRIFNAAPMTFDPSVVEIFLALSSGATLVMVPTALKSMPDKLLDVLIKQSVTHLQVTPSLLSTFNATKLRSSILGRNSNLKVLALGGEQCPEKSTLLRMKHERNETLIYNIYGITEVSSWATCHRVDLHSDAPVYLGEVLSNTVLEVRDELGGVITEGLGRLFIGGERCCVINDEVDSCTMRDSGDEVKILSEGSVIYLGRCDDVIKRNGKRVNLNHIESLLYKYLPSVQTAVVVHHKGTIHLFIKMFSASGDVKSCESIMKLLASHLTVHALPDRVHFVQEIPITNHGKIDKNTLMRSAERRHVQSCTDPKKVFSGIWSDLLGRNAAWNDQFILQGGTSLQAVQLVEQFQHQVVHSFPLLLDKILNQTFADILTYIEQIFSEINSLDSENKDILGKVIWTVTSESSDQRSMDKRQISVENRTDIKRRKLTDYVCPKCHFKRNSHSFNVSSRRSSGCVYGTITSESAVKQRTVENLHLIDSLHWKYNTDKCVDASPLIVQKCCSRVVYIGSHSRRFCAVNMDTGELLWNTALGDRIESSAAISPCGRFIVIGCYDGCVYVLDSETGDIEWKYQTGDAIKSSPVADQITGLFYIGSHDNCLYALDIFECRNVWKTDFRNGSIFSSPCLSTTPYSIYVGTLGGMLTAVNPKNGDILWSMDVGKPIFSSPIATPDGLMVGCVDRNIYCFSHSGEKLWNYQTDGPIFSSPCSYSGRNEQQYTVIGSHDRCVHCIDSKTGKRLWKFETDSSVYSSACIAELILSSDTNECSSHAVPAVIISSTEGTIYVISLQGGSLMTQLSCPGQLFSSPVIHDGHLVVGCRDNNIVCFRLGVYVGDESKADAFIQKFSVQ
ncbi:beta-alanine-activating enzyme-like [Tubulanus polymorphus]|uniref:beta-alanine-activating enzyme-like n=1 Tax=Tubulanus polymorphus TaxID=672921 RepID=UPI003DA41246